MYMRWKMKFSWVMGKVTSSPIDSSLSEWQIMGL